MAYVDPNTYIHPEAKRFQKKFEAEEKRLAESGKAFNSSMSGYDALKTNIAYYSKGGDGYNIGLKDVKLQNAAFEIQAKNLGITPAQLVENPNLATDPEALAKYTGGTYNGTSYAPGTPAWAAEQAPQASVVGAAYQPPPLPVKSSGTYVEDLAKSYDQPATGLGSTATPKVSGDSSALRTQKVNQEIERYKEMLDSGLDKPNQFSSVEEFDKLRKEQGISMDEQELNAIQNEMRQIQQELRQFSAQQGAGVTEGGRVGAITEAERNVSFRLESLAIREQAAVARLNSKNAYISTALQLGQFDYKQAKEDYEFEYNKNLKAIGLMNDDLDDQKADALTTFSTLTNLISEKGITELTPQLRTQLETSALQAGLSPEVVDLMLTQTQAKDKVTNIYSRDDGIYAVMEGADGVPYVKQLSESSNPTGQTIKSGSLEAPESIISVGQADLDATRGQPYKNESGQTITPPANDKYANSKTYLGMLAAWIKNGGLEQDFFKYYPPKLYLNPNDQSIPQYIRDMLKKAEEVDEPLFK